ncbi:MAG: RluA family pseudouridine synthase [Burkholderiaceae bacterium]
MPIETCATSTPIYVDAFLLVLDKPPGLLSVPGRGPDKQDCLSGRIQALYPDALVVHRLDMATSGLMLMARGSAVQRKLSDAFAARQIHKRYRAVVHGHTQAPPGVWQTIDLPIALAWSDRPRRVVRGDGKPSISRWRLLGHQGPSKSWVELEPVTGRTHQLRVHMRAIGHPIVGDTFYGLESDAGLPSTSARLMLHATRIAFGHPTTGDPMRFDMPAPFDTAIFDSSPPKSMEIAG